MSTKLSVCGSIYPATNEGFAKFLLEANSQEADGYELVTLVRLDKSIASVYRRKAAVASATEPKAAFFE